MEDERIFLSPPHLSGDELSFVHEAFDSNYVAPVGPQVDAFEKEFCELTGASHALALVSCTAAIHLALRLIDVGSGDEVFASALTFIGGVAPITYLGATPVFIDSDRASWNMDPDLLEMELTQCAAKGKLPKAVMPTDLYGQCVNLERILDICNRFGVPVICDSAEAMGARYDSNRIPGNSKGGSRYAGIGAKAAVYSFNGNKIITTSGGGMLVSDDEAFINKARFLSQQAREPLPHYEHCEIGYNYRMSNILAAIGRGQLRVLEKRVTQARKIFDSYNDALGDLPGLEFMPEASYGKSTRWLTVALINPDQFGADRETIRLALEEENIESRPVWKPMQLQPVFGGAVNDASGQKGRKRYPCRVVGGAVSEELFERGLSLPSGTALTQEDLKRIVRIIRKLYRP